MIDGVIKTKPMVVILIGGIITMVGGAITIWGTYAHNKASSAKSDKIVRGVDESNFKIASVDSTVNELRTQNEQLREQNEQQSFKIDVLRKENTDLHFKLTETSKDIFNNLTGGDGYIEVIISQFANTQNRQFDIFCRSKYPMYDVSILMEDYSKRSIMFNEAGRENFREKAPEINRLTTIHFNVGNMQASTMMSPLNYELEKKQRDVVIDFRITTRNGSFLEMLRIWNVRTEEQQHAIQIIKLMDSGNKVIFSQIGPKFPVDENGEPIWTWTVNGNIMD